MVPLHLRNLTVSLPWSGSIFTIRPMVLQEVCLPEDHQEIVVLEVPALGAPEIKRCNLLDLTARWPATSTFA